MLAQHLLDCLAIVPHLSGSSLLDVGSGAGLPGIPVAIALPRLPVTLLESSHKKAAFLRQAAIELRLDNVTVVVRAGGSVGDGAAVRSGGLARARRSSGIHPAGRPASSRPAARWPR